MCLDMADSYPMQERELLIAMFQWYRSSSIGYSLLSVSHCFWIHFDSEDAAISAILNQNEIHCHYEEGDKAFPNPDTSERAFSWCPVLNEIQAFTILEARRHHCREIIVSFGATPSPPPNYWIEAEVVQHFFSGASPLQFNRGACPLGTLYHISP